MPEARQNNSKLAEMLASASIFRALVGMAVNVVGLFMALLSFVESAPRAYRLKASNAAPPISTSAGTSANHVKLSIISQQVGELVGSVPVPGNITNPGLFICRLIEEIRGVEVQSACVIESVFRHIARNWPFLRSTSVILKAIKEENVRECWDIGTGYDSLSEIAESSARTATAW